MLRLAGPLGLSRTVGLAFTLASPVHRPSQYPRGERLLPSGPCPNTMTNVSHSDQITTSRGFSWQNLPHSEISLTFWSNWILETFNKGVVRFPCSCVQTNFSLHGLCELVLTCFISCHIFPHTFPPHPPYWLLSFSNALRTFRLLRVVREFEGRLRHLCLVRKSLKYNISIQYFYL